VLIFVIVIVRLALSTVTRYLSKSKSRSEIILLECVFFAKVTQVKVEMY